MRETENELRFKEERTGLLTNQVHLDKYRPETMHELQQMELRSNSPSYQNTQMMHYFLEKNALANDKVAQMRRPSPSTIESQLDSYLNKTDKLERPTKTDFYKLYDTNWKRAETTRPLKSSKEEEM